MKKYLLEFLGSFVLVFLVSGALILHQEPGALLTTAHVELIFCLTLALLTLALGKVTGAHLNPAVTLACAISGSFSWKDLIPYALAQCSGALAASAMLRSLFPQSETLGAVLQTYTDVPAFTQEFNLSLLFLIAVLAFDKTTSANRRRSAVVTGGIALFAAWITGPAFGTGMNPARALRRHLSRVKQMASGSIFSPLAALPPPLLASTASMKRSWQKHANDKKGNPRATGRKLIKYRIGIQHIERILLFLRTMVHQVTHDRLR
jgi:aquaporin Z